MLQSANDIVNAVANTVTRFTPVPAGFTPPEPGFVTYLLERLWQR